MARAPPTRVYRHHGGEAPWKKGRSRHRDVVEATSAPSLYNGPPVTSVAIAPPFRTDLLGFKASLFPRHNVAIPASGLRQHHRRGGHPTPRPGSPAHRSRSPPPAAWKCKRRFSPKWLADPVAPCAAPPSKHPVHPPFVRHLSMRLALQGGHVSNRRTANLLDLTAEDLAELFSSHGIEQPVEL